MAGWKNIQNLLIIRPDNMGDLIMSGPAIRALKETFNCKISVLTSAAGAPVASLLPGVDAFITFDLPWVKTNKNFDEAEYFDLIKQLKEARFDGAIIFTVYSQNPLPSAILAFMAGIPLRLAYCRENPYALLTHWIPDKEPYSFIRHQVVRDLELVRFAGAKTSNDHLKISANGVHGLTNALIPWARKGKYIVVHPFVSEQKRKVSAGTWIQILQQLRLRTSIPVIITGSSDDESDARSLVAEAAISHLHSLAGKTGIDEYIALIKDAALLISVNTSAVHIAAATNTPVVVLYAKTNPQHTPWKVPSRVFLFDVPPALQSKNEVIRFAHNKYFADSEDTLSPAAIVASCMELLDTTSGIMKVEEVAMRSNRK